MTNKEKYWLVKQARSLLTTSMVRSPMMRGLQSGMGFSVGVNNMVPQSSSSTEKKKKKKPRSPFVYAIGGGRYRIPQRPLLRSMSRNGPGSFQIKRAQKFAAAQPSGINKEEIIRQLAELNHPGVGVAGGAAMVLRGLREDTSDIDADASPEVFNELHALHGSPETEVTGMGTRMYNIPGTHIDLHESAPSGEPMEGVVGSVSTPEELLPFYENLNRPKDQQWIKALREKLDVHVLSAIPPGSRELVNEHGLLSSEALLSNPEVLKAVLANRKGTDWEDTEEEFRARVAKHLKDNFWGTSMRGPSIFFGEPDPAKITDKHPMSKLKSEIIKINLSKLLRDHPDTRISGTELVPYDPEGPEHQGDKRHKDIDLDKVREYAAMDPKELWKHYNNPEGTRYASDVPHAQIITPTGIIPPEYIKRASVDPLNAHAVYNSNQGDPKYVFLRDQLTPDQLATLISDDKDGTRKPGQDYKGVGIVGDYYSHPTLYSDDGDNLDIIVVDDEEAALDQFDNYLMGGTKHLTDISFPGALLDQSRA